MVSHPDCDRFDREAVVGRRRTEREAAVVEALRERGGSVTLSDLASDVAQENSETAVVASDDDCLEWIRFRLHHVELPRLADAGLLEYDTERKIVSLPEDRSGSFRLP